MKIKGGEFQILLTNICLNKGDSIVFGRFSGTYVVTSIPKRKWYQIVFQKITFGLFKASIYYTVKPK